MEVKRIKRQLSRTINTDVARSEFIRLSVDLDAELLPTEDVVAAAHKLHEQCREILGVEVQELYKRLNKK